MHVSRTSKTQNKNKKVREKQGNNPLLKQRGGVHEGRRPTSGIAGGRHAIVVEGLAPPGKGSRRERERKRENLWRPLHTRGPALFYRLSLFCSSACRSNERSSLRSLIKRKQNGRANERNRLAFLPFLFVLATGVLSWGTGVTSWRI